MLDRRAMLAGLKQSRLPSGYTEVKSIIGLGSYDRMKLILPNVYVTANFSYEVNMIEFVGAIDTNRTSQIFRFGEYQKNLTSIYSQFKTGRSYVVCFLSSSSYIASEKQIPSTINNVYIYGNMQHLYFGDIATFDGNGKIPVENVDITMCAGAGSYGEYKFYDSRGNIAHLIPAIRNSDRKPCMFDLESNQPLFNQGEGEYGYERFDGTIVSPI